MAELTPLWTGETLTEPDKVEAFLRARGITFSTWELSLEAQELAALPTLNDSQKARLISLFATRLGASGYANADVVAIRPDIPGLSDALAKFDRLHYHDDDEVRAIVGGEGVFGFMTDDDRQFLLKIEAGEYISVPARTWHWFYCTAGRNITALRLFEDMSGWTPHYRSNPAQGNET